MAKILGPSIFLLIPIPINNERSLRKLRVTDGKKPLNKQNMPKSPSSMLFFDLSVICRVVKLHKYRLQR